METVFSDEGGNGTPTQCPGDCLKEAAIIGVFLQLTLKEQLRFAALENKLIKALTKEAPV